MQYQGQIKGKSKGNQGDIKEDSKDVLARSRAFGAGHLRRAKRGEERKREETQIGPRRIGVRGGEIDHKADDRADLVIAPQNAESCNSISPASAALKMDTIVADHRVNNKGFQ